MKETVLWMDGCFDGFHYAHANAARQARALVAGPLRLLGGVHPDEEIVLNKGPPLFDEQERYAMVRGCRWIDEVICGVPYFTQLSLLDDHNIDFVVHGDDIALDAEGRDCFALVKSIGRYKEFKRTQGISTTSLIDRILSPSPDSTSEHKTESLQDLLREFASSAHPPLPMIDLSNEGPRPLIPGGVENVYISGSWDCFGSGHLELLRRTKEFGRNDTAVIVGVWSDEVVRSEDGEPPLFSMLERALMLVQCRYTDGMILSAPRTVSESFLETLGVNSVMEYRDHNYSNAKTIRLTDPPSLPNRRSLVANIEARRDLFEERQRRKRPSHEPVGSSSS